MANRNSEADHINLADQRNCTDSGFTEYPPPADYEAWHQEQAAKCTAHRANHGQGVAPERHPDGEYWNCPDDCPSKILLSCPLWTHGQWCQCGYCKNQRADEAWEAAELKRAALEPEDGDDQEEGTE